MSRIGQLLFIFFMTGCATLSGKNRPQPVKLDSPVLLELSGSVNRLEVIRYHFASHKESSVIGKAEKPEIKDEKVEFAVQTTTREVFPTGDVGYLIETVSRVGDIKLHDLAFPEPGEKLEQILTRNARVVKAGEYSPDSIFYLPPIPLPVEPVKVGDTWTMRHQWASDSTGVPLELDMVAILKGIYVCGENDQCADIEISGQVSLPQRIPKLTLDSEITGHLIFAVQHGSIVWSEIRTTEKVAAEKGRSYVVSCMKSFIEKPAAYGWKWDSQLQCDPKSSYENRIPGILAQE
ncbi:MAG: hypothetical protein ABL958_14040 [Bdellovibrionia bacterium]